MRTNVSIHFPFFESWENKTPLSYVKARGKLTSRAAEQSSCRCVRSSRNVLTGDWGTARGNSKGGELRQGYKGVKISDLM